MRQLVGPTDDADFDNPNGALVYPYLPASAYRSVFDFGCGCGRVARQLIQQDPRPERYVGIDLHRGLIEWCRRELAPHAQNFEFAHHNVFNYHFNPDSSAPQTRRFPITDSSATLVNAWSVFTHLTQTQAEFYLAEVDRVLAPGGVFHSTWFLFDKRAFPMLQRDAAALYVSYQDPSAAVAFDRGWLLEQARKNGLVVTAVTLPAFRGYQWVLVMERLGPDVVEVDLPEDTAVIGEIRLPDVPTDASRIGLSR
jgi:SAM-dependent methyltransferase